MRKLRSRSQASYSLLAQWAVAIAVAVAAVVALAAPAAAEHTRFWRQSDYADFNKGTASGVALRSDGRLVLAPRFAPFADANLAYLWALRMDTRGNLYAAGGSNAKVVRFDHAGKQTVVFESEELTAQALAVDKSNNLYVGTSPDGKVYKVTPDGKKSVYFDPKTKYIWDLALSPDGMLYVATGDTGKIFRVAPDGKGELFYSSDETHIRALAFDGKGDLLAGTEPNGLVLRIPLAEPTPANSADQGDASHKAGAGNKGNARRAYVLYETSKREVTALLADASGDIYVAAIGQKIRPTPAVPGAPGLVPQQQGATVTSTQTITVTASADGTATTGQQNVPMPTTFLPFPRLTGSAVYRIAADGSPEEIWTSQQDDVYSLGLSANGNLLMGVGNQGAVIQLGANRVFTRLARTESAQVMRLLRAPNGTVYVATANPGKIFSLGPDLESQGSFVSQPFDAQIFSRWGRLTWWGGGNAVGPGSGVELYVRAGNTSNPENDWSSWDGPYRDAQGEEVKCPAARFVQWKAVLRRNKDSVPSLSWVDLAYLPKNVAPEINGIAMQDPGVRVSGVGGESQNMTQMPVQLRMPSTTPFSNPGQTAQPLETQTARPFEPTPMGYAQKGYQGVLWSAKDANDDELVYSVYFRAEGEKSWKLLKDKLRQEFYSWDTTSMPDGAYYLKIVASDAPSNPPGAALQSERESGRFLVDNTPPEIVGLTAESTHSAGDPSVVAHFQAKDRTSAVIRAQYSLDAGDWTIALPAGELSDSLDEHYTINLHGLSAGEHTLAVRIYDLFDNVTAAKVTFTVPAAPGH
jgi:sugar lactone lactonase YvrE